MSEHNARGCWVSAFGIRVLSTLSCVFVERLMFAFTLNILLCKPQSLQGLCRICLKNNLLYKHWQEYSCAPPSWKWTPAGGNDYGIGHRVRVQVQMAEDRRKTRLAKRGVSRRRLIARLKQSNTTQKNALISGSGCFKLVHNCLHFMCYAARVLHFTYFRQQFNTV